MIPKGDELKTTVAPVEGQFEVWCSGVRLKSLDNRDRAETYARKWPAAFESRKTWALEDWDRAGGTQVKEETS